MAKPRTRRGYSAVTTAICERVLVTLLSGLGPWKESVYLVGGLVPRYLAPGGTPPHAGTIDVDVVIDLQLLVKTQAYRSLEENLRGMGFAPVGANKNAGASWRWEVRTEGGVDIVLEFLTDSPGMAGGQAQVIPGEGAIQALHIPHSSIVFDRYQLHEVHAELLDQNGVANENIRHADIVSFTCLKAFAFEQRGEHKDAHDLIYCLEHSPGAIESVVESFREARTGKHSTVVEDALQILRKRFVSDAHGAGYQKDGPTKVAKFELDAGEPRETQLLRQRNVAELVKRLLGLIG